MKTADIFQNCLKKRKSAQQSGCVIVDGAEGPIADLTDSLTRSPDHGGQSVVTWQAKDWDSIVSLAAQMTPAILSRVGLADRYEGKIIIDLRYCEGPPAMQALLHLTDFLEPLADDCTVFVLVCPEAARSVQGALSMMNPLCLSGKGKTPRPRIIGFERGEEYELP